MCRLCSGPEEARMNKTQTHSQGAPCKAGRQTHEVTSVTQSKRLNAREVFRAPWCSWGPVFSLGRQGNV